MFKNPFSFEGRIRRTEYGLSIIIVFAFAFIVGLTELEDGIMHLLLIPAYWFGLAQGAKRCHDRGDSGWYQIIPFYGLFMLFADSDNGINIYGPNPKGIGNTIKSVKIGKQIWMTENLNVDKYRNGDPIPHAKTNEEWQRAGENINPAWCYYDNDPANGAKYGKLYNWYAVNDRRGLAPEGWRIPTETDFEKLSSAVNDDGNALKSIGQGTGRGAGTNESGFSALLAGVHYYNGDFSNLGSYAFFWSSTKLNATDVHYLYLEDNHSYIVLSISTKDDGFSVRCVQD